MSSFRTKRQCNHAATAIEISATLLLQINRIAWGKKNIATGAKRGQWAIERARAWTGADWVHMAIVLYFKMGNFEKPISELFWNNMEWNQPRWSFTQSNTYTSSASACKDYSKVSPAARFHLCVPLLLPGDHMQSVGYLAMPTMAELMIGMIKTVMLMSISSLDLGWAPGTGFIMMCSGVPVTQHSVTIWHREQTLPASVCHLFCVSLQGKSILPLCFRV